MWTMKEMSDDFERMLLIDADQAFCSGVARKRQKSAVEMTRPDRDVVDVDCV